jgi:hypothetical protein
MMMMNEEIDCDHAGVHDDVGIHKNDDDLESSIAIGDDDDDDGDGDDFVFVT